MLNSEQPLHRESPPSSEEMLKWRLPGQSVLGKLDMDIIVSNFEATGLEPEKLSSLPGSF